MDSISKAEKQIAEILKKLEKEENVIIRNVELSETNMYSVIHRQNIPSIQVVIRTKPLERVWLQ
jgi:hypothetical protein